MSNQSVSHPPPAAAPRPASHTEHDAVTTPAHGAVAFRLWYGPVALAALAYTALLQLLVWIVAPVRRRGRRGHGCAV